MMKIEELLDDVSTLAIVCTQWGDTGKGKFVDFLAEEWADIIARGTGGANAGHTICIGKYVFVFHLLPSGILHDSKGKVNLIGSGVALAPRPLVLELKMLKGVNRSYGNLKIAHNARLVLPQHILLDRLRDASSSGKIGTTGRGMGPVYVDHVDRIGLTVNDIFNRDVFIRKLRKNMERKKVELQQAYRADPEVVKAILNHEDLDGGIFYHRDHILDVDAIVAKYCEYAEMFRGCVIDTDAFLSERVGKQHILLEGAQGNLLSLDRGTYPYVTPSDCAKQGLARGVGLREDQVDRTFGIVKAYAMSRVGGGPFPTEIGGTKSDEWCNGSGVTKAIESERYPDASVNSRDPFEQGVGIRRAGGEYGATTGRPRRVGWLDLPLLRYSLGFTGRDTILTKLDVLDKCERIKICTEYRYDGPEYRIAERVLKPGEILQTAIPDCDVLQHCTPQYQEFDGWLSDTSECRSPGDLPPKLRALNDFIAREAGLNLVMLSVGPDRGQTIVMD